jgi:hypothetical protein
MTKMKRWGKGFTIFYLTLMILMLMGCSSGKPASTEHDAGEVALCDLPEDKIGWRLTTQGEITFIDLSPPDGVYVELTDGGCEGAGFIHNEFWDDLTEDQQGSVALGNAIKVEGILTKDEGRLLVSVQKLEGIP